MPVGRLVLISKWQESWHDDFSTSTKVTKTATSHITNFWFQTTWHFFVMRWAEETALIDTCVITDFCLKHLFRLLYFINERCIEPIAEWSILQYKYRRPRNLSANLVVKKSSVKKEISMCCGGRKQVYVFSNVVNNIYIILNFLLAIWAKRFSKYSISSICSSGSNVAKNSS